MIRDGEGTGTVDKALAQFAVDAAIFLKCSNYDAVRAKRLCDADITQHDADFVGFVAKSSCVRTDHHHDFDTTDRDTLLDEPVAGRDPTNAERAANLNPIRTSSHSRQCGFDKVNTDFKDHG